MRTHLKIAFGLAFGLGPIDAQSRLFDLNTTPPIGNPGGGGRDFVRVGGEVAFFAGSTPSRELYFTDGTAPGTRFVRQFAWHANDITLVSTFALGNRLLFTLHRPDTGFELWVSDGTEAGTRMLRDFLPGPTSGMPYPAKFVEYQGLAWFGAGDPSLGFELWRSDGTDAGTQLAVDIWQGPPGGGPTDLVVANGKMFLLAADGAHGRELWVSDGSPAGTWLVADLSLYSSINNLTAFGTGVLFTTIDPVFGEELFYSDGTAPGTHMVADLVPGSGSSIPRGLQRFQSEVLFEALDAAGQLHLWRTNGTTAGTQPMFSPGTHSTIYYPIVARRTLFFWEYATNTGWDLWRSDGTGAGTNLVLTTPPMSGYFNIGELPLADGLAVLFNDGVHGSEPWFVPPLGPATLIADLRPGSAGSSPGLPRALADELWFTADDGVHGPEPWVYSRTTGNIHLVADLVSAQSHSYPAPLGEIDQDLIFGATAGPGLSGLWRTDGTLPGTINLVSTPTAYAGVGLLASEPNALWLQMDDGVHGWELWRTDGTPAGTVLVKDITPGPASTYMSGIRLGPWFLFGAYNSSGAGDLWRSDGTASGTTVLTAGIRADTFVRVDDTILFIVDPGSTQARLWRTDGTPSGTWVVPSSPNGVTGLSSLGSIAVFRIYQVANQLWRTDGTASGTWSFPTSFPTAPLVVPYGLTRLGNIGVFTASDTTHGFELWRTDGTAAGTYLLADTYPGPTSGDPRRLTPAMDRLFFAADSPTMGTELWVTDGTPSGTQVVLDIMPGPLSSMLNAQIFAGPNGEPIAHNRRVVFLAEDFVHGQEFWVSDGTGPGTRMLSDATPGSRSSEALIFARAGERLYWRGHDVDAGYELWGLALADVGIGAATPFGSSCGTGSFAPRIGAGEVPRLDNPAFSLLLDAGPPLAPALILLGTGRSDLNLGGCTLYPALPAELALFLTDAAGEVVAAAPIPNSPLLLGASMFAQWVALAAGGPFGDAVTSDALHLIVGG